MCGDVEKHYRSCLECVSRRGSGRSNPPLSPIPVGGPFHRLGVDILQLPLTESGIATFLYLWITSPNRWKSSPFGINNCMFAGHGAPELLLSDRGANFLSDLFSVVCKLLKHKQGE